MRAERVRGYRVCGQRVRGYKGIERQMGDSGVRGVRAEDEEEEEEGA